MFEFTGNGKYIFPSMRSYSRTISENTLVNALRNIGYSKEELVAHSFRGIASTILYENIPMYGVHTDAIERQMAHDEKNAVKGAYNHAEYLENRTHLKNVSSVFGTFQLSIYKLYPYLTYYKEKKFIYDSIYDKNLFGLYYENRKTGIQR